VKKNLYNSKRIKCTNDSIFLFIHITHGFGFKNVTINLVGT